jgi:hypothetical protein
MRKCLPAKREYLDRKEIFSTPGKQLQSALILEDLSTSRSVRESTEAAPLSDALPLLMGGYGLFVANDRCHPFQHLSNL